MILTTKTETMEILINILIIAIILFVVIIAIAVVNFIYICQKEKNSHRKKMQVYYDSNERETKHHCRCNEKN